MLSDDVNKMPLAERADQVLLRSSLHFRKRILDWFPAHPFSKSTLDVKWLASATSPPTVIKNRGGRDSTDLAKALLTSSS